MFEQLTALGKAPKENETKEVTLIENVFYYLSPHDNGDEAVEELNATILGIEPELKDKRILIETDFGDFYLTLTKK